MFLELNANEQDVVDLLVIAPPVIESLNKVLRRGVHALVDIARKPFFDATGEELLMLLAAELIGEAIGEDEEAVARLVIYDIVGESLLGATIWERLATDALASALNFLELAVLGAIESARAAHVEIIERTVRACELNLTGSRVDAEKAEVHAVARIGFACLLFESVADGLVETVEDVGGSEVGMVGHDVAEQEVADDGE